MRKLKTLKNFRMELELTNLYSYGCKFRNLKFKFKIDAVGKLLNSDLD